MKQGGITNRKDILLLLLYAPGLGEATNEPMTGRTRLVKALFLFKNEALPHFKAGTEISEDNFYEFFAWHFGPFSAQVYDDLAFFILNDFIQVRSSSEESADASSAEWQAWVTGMGTDTEDTDPSYLEEEFRLSEKGSQFVETRLWNQLSTPQRELLVAFKKRMQSPLRAILRYVYSSYPDSIENSKITNEVLGDNAWT